MINKEEFVEIINKLRKVNDFVDETNKKARELDDAIISDFYNTMSLSISHENIVVKLLENMFNDTEIISWWLYEKDYGRKSELKMWDEFGKEIDLSTADKLYEYLINEWSKPFIMQMNTEAMLKDLEKRYNIYRDKTYLSQDVKLSKNQHTILKILLENRGKIISCELLCKAVFNSETDEYDKNAVRTTIHRLREKLNGEIVIKTKQGRGYYIDC